MNYFNGYDDNYFMEDDFDEFGYDGYDGGGNDTVSFNGSFNGHLNRDCNGNCNNGRSRIDNPFTSGYNRGCQASALAALELAQAADVDAFRGQPLRAVTLEAEPMHVHRNPSMNCPHHRRRRRCCRY